MNLLLYSSDNSQRLKYISNQVFLHWMGLSIEWTENTVYYQNYQGSKINYSNSALEKDDFLIPKCPFLSEGGVKNRLFSTFLYNKIPALFKTDTPNSVFPCDIFANLFFHLSRYEEYLPFKSDQYGRFPASESWAYQNACLQIPIVNLLIAELKNKLKNKFPTLIFKKQSFQFLPTYDIDMAWAFRHKGWKRGIGGYAKDVLNGRFIYLKNRIKTHLHLKKDPFQTFDLLENWTQKHQIHPIYFFLLGDYSPYDTNSLVTNSAFQKLIQSIADHNNIGIHPSYQSSKNQSIINKEKIRLATITNQKIHRSRQHFLKLHLPQTYRQLLNAGITEDYSMGYAMDTGFRASTALPFYWYDLEKEMETELLIYPFQVMEVTLKEYLHFNPKEAKERISALIKTVKSVNGIFCSLWHNSSFSELEGYGEWEGVYVDLLEKTCLEIEN